MVWHGSGPTPAVACYGSDPCMRTFSFAAFSAHVIDPPSRPAAKARGMHGYLTGSGALKLIEPSLTKSNLMRCARGRVGMGMGMGMQVRVRMETRSGMGTETGPGR